MRVVLALSRWLIILCFITGIQLQHTDAGQAVTQSIYRALVSDTPISSALPGLQAGELAVVASESTYRFAFGGNTDLVNDQ